MNLLTIQTNKQEFIFTKFSDKITVCEHWLSIKERNLFFPIFIFEIVFHFYLCQDTDNFDGILVYKLFENVHLIAVAEKGDIDTSVPIIWTETAFSKAWSFFNRTLVLELINPCELAINPTAPGYAKDFKCGQDNYTWLFNHMEKGCLVVKPIPRDKRVILTLLPFVPWNYVLYIEKTAL